MFPEERTNTHNDNCKGRLSMMLDKTVRWVCALLKDHWCLTITDMQGKMAAHFSHDAWCNNALQVEMWKICAGFSTTHRTSKKSLVQEVRQKSNISEHRVRFYFTKFLKNSIFRENRENFFWCNIWPFCRKRRRLSPSPINITFFTTN